MLNLILWWILNSVVMEFWYSELGVSVSLRDFGAHADAHDSEQSYHGTWQEQLVEIVNALGMLSMATFMTRGSHNGYYEDGCLLGCSTVLHGATTQKTAILMTTCVLCHTLPLKSTAEYTLNSLVSVQKITHSVTEWSRKFIKTKGIQFEHSV
jgi:hypothetical protein